jgi:site-specific DNA recombinase
MKSYFAYIRVSTVKQGEHGSSLQEQKSAIEVYAARHNLQIAQWFEETETAAKQGRREFNRLTNLLRKGKASGVIIHKIDRSARNLKDWAGLGELIDAGVEVLFAHEGLDMQTRGGRLAADIQAVVAADFIRNLRDEVRKGFYGRLKQGFYPLPAPRGYIDCGKAKAKEIHPVDGPLVRQAFELYATGNFSIDSLRFEMAERGLLSATSKPLVLDSMARLLHNPFYIGLMHIIRTNETFPGCHRPLVTKALFDRVQTILSGRHYPRVEKHEFLFRRLIKCDVCAKSLTGERQKGIVYYRCHNYACRGVSVTEVKTDNALASQLALLTLDDRDVKDFRDLLGQQIGIEDTQQGDRVTNMERDLALIQNRIERLTDAFIDGTVDKEASTSGEPPTFIRGETCRTS